MNGEALRVDLATPTEAEMYLAHARGRAPVREVHLGFGLALKGSAEMRCREEKTGELVWEEKLDNIITDAGRRFWFDTYFGTMTLATYISSEPLDYRRYSINGPADGTSLPVTAAQVPVVDGGLLTKTWSTTFAAPGSTRLLGMVSLSASNARVGTDSVYAYLLLSPTKTQSTTQTLELVYKVALLPIA